MRRALAIVIWLAAARLATATDTAYAACGFAAHPQNVLEERLLADAADGRLDEFSPLGAALVASGVEDADCLRRYQQKAAALADQLRRSGKLTGTPRQRVEAIFEFMHRRVLRGGYDLAYTDLRRVLDDGRFNCVSATVLFNYLAGELGLDCRGLEMPGHAMSRSRCPTARSTSRTTCPRWFRLTGDPKQQTSAAAQTIGAAASADRSQAREVSPIQMAAMIYYNRGVDLLGGKALCRGGRAPTPRPCGSIRNNATARGNLLATINNWSIELGNRQHFAEAVDLLRQGLAMDAKFAAFAQNYVHVHHQWVEHLCRRAGSRKHSNPIAGRGRNARTGLFPLRHADLAGGLAYTQG